MTVPSLARVHRTGERKINALLGGAKPEQKHIGIFQFKTQSLGVPRETFGAPRSNTARASSEDGAKCDLPGVQLVAAVGGTCLRATH